ncbi:hypothetical protein [Kitasatospora aureofaciens]|uniref:hypothetical protein n=1 Tax=Kitasatospora aureofaciens TaxID=1894 RepID=UPI0036F45EEE
MISAEQVIYRAGDEGVMPLITLNEFFDGNDNEGSIAPNQWGYGRPALAELAERLRVIEQREDVAWVRVQLHPETMEMEELAGEAVAICTTAGESVRAAWIDGAAGPLCALLTAGHGASRAWLSCLGLR